MASSARLDELRKKFDENPRRYFAPLANEYRKAGETEQAIAICREYLPQQPGHMSGHIVFGQALYEARQFEEAKTVFETALSLDPENLIALRHLGDISLILGDSEGARTWYRRVLDADPRNEEIQAQLAALEKAAAAAPTPAVTPAQTAEGTTRSRAPTPSSAPTVVVQAVKPPAAGAGQVTATSPTAEIRLDDIVPPAPEAPRPAQPAIPAIEKSTEATLEVHTTSVTPSPLDAHHAGEPAEANAPVEGLESHAAASEAPPLDSFSLEGLETTSMGDASAPPAPAPLPGLDITDAAVPDAPAPLAGFDIPDAAAPESPATLPDLEVGDVVLAGEPVSAVPEPSRPEPPPVRTPVVDVAPSDELPPLDLDLGGVGTAAAPEPPSPQPPEQELVFLEPEALAADAGQAAPAQSGPFVTETMAELYLQQGHRDEALRVYRALLEQRPADAELREKIQRIESEMAGPPAAVDASATGIPRERGGPRMVDVLRMVALRRPGYRPEAVQGGTGGNGTSAGVEAAVSGVAEPGELMGAPAPEAEVSSTAPAPSGRADALASTLGFAVASASDESAARLLATAFAINGAGDISGAPARPASSELSLDTVFGGARSAAPSGPPPSSFSFDQFFANRDAGTAGEAAGTARESAEDVAQFTQWLEGLKGR